MKHKICKIAFALNIIGFISAVIINIADFDLGVFENNSIALVALLAFLFLTLLLPPFLFGVSYLLGLAKAEDYMIISSVASLLVSLVFSAGKNRSNFFFLFLYLGSYAFFAIIKHRKRITKKHVVRVLLALLAVGVIQVALKIENIIRDVKISEYDEQGNLICSQSGGLKTLYEYQNGRLVKENRTWELDYPVTIFEYDENGNKIIEKEVSKNGESEKTGSFWKYNEKNQLTQFWDDWSKRSTYYFYDEKGQKIKEVRDTKETLFEYDQNGNLIKQTNPDGKVLYSEYDENGKLIRETDYRDKIWHFEYNENGTLSKRFCDTEIYEVEYFEDEVEKERHSIRKILVDGEFQTDFEFAFDRDGNRILKKYSRHFYRYFYPTFCTHWKNGGVKTKRVYEIEIGW